MKSTANHSIGFLFLFVLLSFSLVEFFSQQRERKKNIVSLCIWINAHGTIPSIVLATRRRKSLFVQNAVRLLLSCDFALNSRRISHQCDQRKPPHIFSDRFHNFNIYLSDLANHRSSHLHCPKWRAIHLQRTSEDVDDANVLWNNRSLDHFHSRRLTDFSICNRDRTESHRHHKCLGSDYHRDNSLKWLG